MKYRESLKSFQKRRRLYPISFNSEALDKIEVQLWTRAQVESRVQEDDDNVFKTSYKLRKQTFTHGKNK